METHACNPSWEATTRESWEILGQPMLHSEFIGYIVKPVLRNRSGRAAAGLEKATLVALHSAFSRSCAKETLQGMGSKSRGPGWPQVRACCGLPLKPVSAGGMASNCPDSAASVPGQEASDGLRRA